MWATLLTLVPVGLVLGLLAFGDYGAGWREPTRTQIAAVAAVAVLAGPVASAVLGLFGWLLAILVAVCVFVIVAMLRTPQAPARRLRAQ